MREQVIINVNGYKVKVDLIYSSSNSRTYHYCFGIINVRVKQNYHLSKLTKDLEKIFPVSTLEKFNAEPFIDGNYAYIFGEVERVYPTKGNTLDGMYVFYKGKKVLAKKVLLDVITSRVRYYENIMNLSSHEIKIKKLSAALGNNHYNKKILTFNENLIHFSLDLIDQVVVHELCHDFYQNHSKQFYDKLSLYCPDYKLRKEKLIYGIRK